MKTSAPKRLNRADLEKAAASGNSTVYEWENDNVFTPWPAERVRSAVQKLCQIARDAGDAARARAEALTDPELRRFSELYVFIFQKFSDPEAAKDEKKIGMMMHLIEISNRLQTGTVNEKDAYSEATKYVLSEHCKNSAKT